MPRLDTGSNANQLQDVYLTKRFVKTLESKLVVLQLTDKEITPPGIGDTVRWQFFNNPSAATTALTEGSDPTGGAALVDIDTTTASGTLLEYGAFSELSKLFLRVAVSGTKEGITARLAYQAALSVDTLLFTLALQDSTGIDNAGTSMSAEDVRSAVLALEQSDAMPHPATPGGQFFAGVFSPEAAYDMMGEGAPTWFQAKSNDFRDSLVTPFRDSAANAGLYNTVIKTSTNVQRDTGVSPDDDLNYIVSGNSIGSVSLDSMKPRMITTDPETRVDVPLRNRGTIGWHVVFDATLFEAGNRTREILSDATGVG